MNQNRPLRRRVCAGVLAIVLCAGTLPMNGIRNAQYSVASVTAFAAEAGEALAVSDSVSLKCIAENTYVISTADELAALRDAVNSTGTYGQALGNCIGMTFQLQKDIDLSAYCDEKSGKCWIPIGGAGNGGFRGVFDGNGHTIKHLYIKRDYQNSIDGAGLFNNLTEALIENLTVEGKIEFTKDMANSHAAGGICGVASLSRFYNCVNKVTIHCPDQGNVGGIVGTLKGDRLETVLDHCTNLADIDTDSDGPYIGETIGGIAGSVNGCIADCTNEGNVTGRGIVGGIVGAPWNIGGIPSIKGCHNSGKITATERTHAGGIAASVTQCLIEDCHNTGDIQSAVSFGGGIAAELSGGLDGCTNTGAVAAYGRVGGIVGAFTQGEDMSVKDCTNGGDVTCTDKDSVSGVAYCGGILGASGDVTITGAVNTGKITAYQQYSGGIAGAADVVSMTDCHNEGEVSSTRQNAGGLCGILKSGTITSCSNIAPITGDYTIGGLIGESTESNSLTITDSYNTGAITATIAAGSRQSYAGGLAGNVKYGTMQNCRNSGDVKSAGGLVGGIAGMIEGGLDGCVNSGTVTAYNAVGGIAGSFVQGKDMSVKDCTNNGDITAESHLDNVMAPARCGGIIGVSDELTMTGSVNTGKITAYSLFSGGLCGILTKASSLTDCQNEGEVSSTAEDTGGICGRFYEGTITDCSNSAPVTGKFCVGGLIGDNHSITITGSYNTGDITSTGTNGYDNESFAGGLAGYAGSGKIQSSYNSGVVKAVGKCAGGIAGESECYFQDVLNNCAVTSDADFVGGIAGYYCNKDNDSQKLIDGQTANLQSCRNLGDISGANSVGGLFGKLDYGTDYLYDSFNTGTVTGTDEQVGGLVGTAQKVVFVRDYSAGNVNAADLAAGLVAKAEQSTATDCYVYGDITSDSGTAYIMTPKTETYENCWCDSTFYTANETEIPEVEGVTAMPRTAFESGEVCWRMNQADAFEDDIWFQTLGGKTPDKFPVFAGETPEVFQVIFQYDQTYFKGQKDTYQYTNEHIDPAWSAVKAEKYWHLLFDGKLAPTEEALTEDTTVTISEEPNPMKLQAEEMTVEGVYDAAVQGDISMLVSNPDEVGELHITVVDAKGNVLPDGIALAELGALSGKPGVVGDFSVKVNITAENTETADVTTLFKIVKADPKVTAPKAAKLTYTGEKQTLITAGKTNGGTLQYSLDGKTYSEKLPTAAKAGKYTVYYMVEGNEFYNSTEAKKLTVTIAKKAVEITAKDTEVTYNGNAIDLSKLYTVSEAENSPSLTVIDQTGESVLEGVSLTPTKAGTFKIIVSVDESENYLEAEKEILLTVNKGEVILMLSIQNFFEEGEEVQYAIVQDPGDIAPVIEFKAEDAKKFTAEKPTAPGYYTLRVTVPESDLYQKAVQEHDFIINAATTTTTTKATTTTTTTTTTTKATTKATTTDTTTTSTTPKATTTGTTTTTKETTTDTTTTESKPDPDKPGETPTVTVKLGDVNGDDAVNASDAADILLAAAAVGAGEENGLTAAQMKAADINNDGKIDASDAATALLYAAAVGAGQVDAKIEDFI